MSTVTTVRGQWHRAFLVEYRKDGNMTRAAMKAGISAMQVRRTMAEKPKFADRVRQAAKDARRRKVDAAEAELRRRAVRGWREPIYQGGVLVGHRRKYSDACLLRHLEAESPGKYGRKPGALTINNNQQITAEVRIAMLLDPEKRKAACDLAAIVAAPRAIQGPSTTGSGAYSPAAPSSESGE